MGLGMLQCTSTTTTVFSVFQNLERPTWFGKKINKFFFEWGFSTFWEFYQNSQKVFGAK
jgi:hypothetical protein